MLRELDRRINGDDVIALYWDGERRCGKLVIDRSGVRRTCTLPPHRIADALRHPYLYLAFPVLPVPLATAA